MIDPIVRPARIADSAEVANLAAAARAPLADQRGGRRWLDEHPDTADWTARLSAAADDHAVTAPRPIERVLVADLDGLVVGYLLAIVEGGIVHIDEVYVRPEARELGFGDALLESALAFGREHGASLVEGEALPGDRTTKNLFERAGITARKIIVSAPLSDRATEADASR